jgi:hypothetical protein
MKQEKLPASRFSAKQKERVLLKKVDKLIRSGDLFKAAKLSVALMRRGKPSLDAEKIFRRLSMRLELQAKIAFHADDRKELLSIVKITGQLAVRRVPTALRVHRSVKKLLGKTHLLKQRRPSKGKVKPAAKKAKTTGQSRDKKKGQTEKYEGEEIRFGGVVAGGAVGSEEIISTPPYARRGLPENYGTTDAFVLEEPSSRRGGSEETESDEPEINGSGGDEFPVAVRDAIVERVPHMDLDSPEPIPPGRIFKVYVYADETPARPGEEAEPMVFRVPPETIYFAVEVELRLTSHFVWVPEALPHRKNRLVIRRDEPETEKLEFVLMVREKQELAPTEPAISAIFHFRRRPSGKVTRKINIEGLMLETPVRSKDETAGPKEAVGQVASLALAHDAVSPDLIVSVLEREDKDGRNFDIIVDSGTLPARWSGKWTLGQRTDEIVKAAMATFQTASRPAVKLKGAGIAMFSATPPEFQKMFWKMVDEKKLPRHILVISEEPYIPWELMVPQRRLPNGKFETRAPLGVEFCVGRWITDKYLSPPQKIGFPQVSVIAPDYPVGRQLKYSAAEVATIKKCFESVDKISPALVKNIDDVLAQKGAALLHFVCHGKAGIPQSISLDQDQEQLSSWDIRALNGFLSSFEKAKTFVFLNACEVGRVAPEIVGIGGFGNAFASIGASGVVAPLWSVDDSIAHQVAELFYTRVIARPTIPFAEILRDIRAKAYAENGEDTWAAYCFYGDPIATLV